VGDREGEKVEKENEKGGGGEKDEGKEEAETRKR
jgi:hypothetical protein